MPSSRAVSGIRAHDKRYVDEALGGFQSSSGGTIYVKQPGRRRGASEPSLGRQGGGLGRAGGRRGRGRPPRGGPGPGPPPGGRGHAAREAPPTPPPQPPAPPTPHP